MNDLTGQTIDRYHILEQIGEGGMAVVYKAYDTRLEREVAIKIIRKEAFPPEALDRIFKRFEREAKALAKLSHPNIINIFDFGEYESSPFLVMEYHPGGTLKDLLGNQIPWEECLQYIRPIAQALAYAHGQGIIHRDIKPSNILISKNGEPKLSDFGIAKLLESDEKHTLTATGVGIGTPEYMAPEQGLGKQIDGRSDLYSLSIVLYEMLTGRTPFKAETPMAVIISQINDPLPRPKLYIDNLPDQIEKFLIKALAKNPQNRFTDLEAFIKALDNIKIGSTKKNASNSTNNESAKSKSPTKPFKITSIFNKESTRGESDGGKTELVVEVDKTQIHSASFSVKKLILYIAVPSVVIILGFLIANQNQLTTLATGNAALSESRSTVSSPNELTPTSINVKTIANTASAIPSRTPSSTPTIIPSKTNTPVPTEISDGMILYQNSFADSSAKGWDNRSSTSTKILSEEGNRFLHFKATGFAYPGMYLVDDQKSWKNYAFESSIRLKNGGIFICFRAYGKGASFYNVFLDTDGKWVVFADYDSTRGDNSYKTFGGISNDLPQNQWIKVRVEIIDNNMSLFIDNKLITTAQNSSHSSGGIGYYAGENGEFDIDDIKVWKLE